MREKTNLERIAADVRANVKILERTDGWWRLTPMQQKLIRASFIVNDRAERGSREISSLRDDFILNALTWIEQRGVAQRLTAGLWLKRMKALYRHQPSREHVDAYTCMMAVYVLEELEHLRAMKPFSGDVPRELPSEDFLPGKSFCEGTRYNFKNTTNISEVLKDEFPYVCHIRKAGALEGELGVMHTFLVMGKIDDDYIVWEKPGRREGYTRSKLADVLKEYDPRSCDYFVRPMKTFKQN